MKQKILFDTSVLVAALVRVHSSHKRCLKYLQSALKGDCQGYVSAHTIAELYAVLTRLPAKPRISPAMALKLVQDNVKAGLEVVALSEEDYFGVIQEMADIGLTGGVVYDAIISKCAIKGGVDVLLTLNSDDFERVWLKHDGVVQAP